MKQLEQRMAALARSADLAFWLRVDVDAERQRALEEAVAWAFEGAFNDQDLNSEEAF